MKSVVLRTILAFSLPLLAQEPAKSTSPPDAEEAAYPSIERLIQVMESIRTRHPDVDKLTYERLVNHALEGMLSSLDPHSSYIHPEMAAAMKSHGDIDPFIPSLGMTIGLRDGGPYIATLTANGPAAQGQAELNAQILLIDSQNPATLEWPALLKLLRKAPGEITTLQLKSGTEPKPYECRITHIRVEEKALTHAELLKDHPTIAYLRLAQFSNDCHKLVESALDDLEDKGAKALILDLRGNGGGDLPATVQLLGLFVKPKTDVVTVRTRDPKEWQTLTTPEPQRRKREYPMAVLIDRMSASASELTAGALQDIKRATVIGETSYGKGSVQNIIPMNNGTALRLTIATYHTPSGRTPHGVGITPDLAVYISENDRANFPLSLVKSTLPPAKQKELESWQDPCLRAAIKAVSE
jgi:carboxyl-terminal processing protease